MLVFLAPTDASFCPNILAIYAAIGFLLPKKQDVDVENNCLLVCLTSGFPPPRCKMQLLQVIVCLTSRFLPPSLDFYFPKMQDVDVAMIVCWFFDQFVCLTKMQETDFAIIVCLTSTMVYS